MKEKMFVTIIKNVLLFFFYIFFIEMIIRFNLSNPFFNWATIRIGISSLIFALIIGIIVSTGPKLMRTILAIIFATFIVIYAWAQINMHNDLGLFMGWGMQEQGAKVLDFALDLIRSAGARTYLLFVPYVLVMFYYTYLERKLRIRKLNKTNFVKIKIETKLHRVLTFIIILLIMTFLSLSYYFTLTLDFMQNRLQTTPNTELFRYPENSNLAVSQFGVLTYLVTDSISHILGFEARENDSSDGGEIVYRPGTTDPEDPTRVIDDALWHAVIREERNSAMNNIHRYLINRPIPPRNEMTGIFEGKNLIVILMESVNDIFIHPEYFPTFYRMFNEGISFRNNYSPRNGCTTGNNEMTVVTSLFSINNNCTVNQFQNNRYFQSIYNVFNQAGYNTSSYHNHGDIFYNRRILHRNWGSTIYRGPDDLGISWSSNFGQWASDLELKQAAIPHFIEDTPFMSFIIGVSPHRVYNVESVTSARNAHHFANSNYSRPVRNYLSKLMELEYSLAYLLEALEEAGELENTVIALFSDHQPHGLTAAQIHEVLDYDVTVRREADRTPMVIYHSGTPAQQIYKYSTLIDLLPTLLNMFDIDHDPRHYFGIDLFSDAPGRAIFADGSWQDHIGFFSAISGRFTVTNSEGLNYTRDELAAINAHINQMQRMSANIIRNDYFRHLERAKTRLRPQLEPQVPDDYLFEIGC